MSITRGPLTTLSDDPSARSQIASWYAQGVTDGFGDRLLMFDNAATGPLELLRLRPDFSFIPAFEASVRARVRQLASLTHKGFALARAVNHLENGEGLTVVSAHVPGTRLSDLFQSTRPHGGMHPVSVRWALGELVPALAELHRQSGDIAHGALAPDRIVITADRRLVITDYVFGDALANLRLPADRLWAEFGVVPTTARDSAVLDQRSDIVQVALITISLVLGRRVSPTEYPQHLHKLIDEFTAACNRRAPSVTPGLRTWLEGALYPNGYASAIEGELALMMGAGLPEASSIEVAGRPAATPVPAPPPPRPVPAVRPAATTSIFESRPVAREEEERAETPQTSRVMVNRVAAVLSTIVLLQSAAMVALMFRSSSPAGVTRISIESASPGAMVLVNGQQVGVTPLDLPLGGGQPSIRVVPPQVSPVARTSAVLPVSARVEAGLGPTAGKQPEAARSGGVRVVSPIPVQVMEGEHVLGSSGGPIYTTPGVHRLELVNSTLGYRTTQSIRVVAGRVTPLQVEPPAGRISINAQPWAQVLIDGKPVGDTPLANLSVALGEHEVVFRHPQLGEQRQIATVKADALTRVSANFPR
jgi:hypothetical protein